MVILIKLCNFGKFRITAISFSQWNTSVFLEEEVLVFFLSFQYLRKHDVDSRDTWFLEATDKKELSRSFLKFSYFYVTNQQKNSKTLSGRDHE